MRRFASVFASKRSDKSDSSSTTLNTNPTSDQNTHTAKKISLKRPHSLNVVTPTTPSPPTVPSTPQLSTSSEPTQSSGSSSGSVSLRTPDDDAILSRTSTKKSWISWLGGKRSNTIKRTQLAEEWDRPMPEWQPLPAPILRPPPSGNRAPSSARPVDDTEEDTSSESDDYYDSASRPVNPPATCPTLTPLTLAQSRRNLHTVISNSLVPSVAPSPFLHVPGTPFFPRSCNVPCSLPAKRTLLSDMQKKHLLRRLEGNAQALTHDDELSILPFSARPTSQDITKEPAPSINDVVLPNAKQVAPTSPGLKRWFSRTCFEDRFVVWSPAEVSRGVVCKPVTGTSFGVAELEFSEGLETMAGLDIESNPTIEVQFDPLKELSPQAPPEPQEEPEATSSASSSSSQLSGEISPPLVYCPPLISVWSKCHQPMPGTPHTSAYRHLSECSTVLRRFRQLLPQAALSP